MRRADHSAIFIGIAGTSTGVAGLALTGWSQALMLSLVWTGRSAASCCARSGSMPRSGPSPSPMSWWAGAPSIVAPQLVRSLGGVGFGLMLVAGFAYTAGALIYARKRPDPWPGVFGFHEVFHACTVIGAAIVRLPRRLHRAAALLRRGRRVGRYQDRRGARARFVGRG